jgi:hypothetical protein
MKHSFHRIAILSVLVFMACSATGQNLDSKEPAKDASQVKIAPAPVMIEMNSPEEVVNGASQEAVVKTVTPIYSQLLYMGYPRGFKVASENTTSQRYIRESVPEGEDPGAWTQMVTISGVKETASEATISPANYAEHIAGGFRRACSESFSQRKMSEGIVNGYEQYVMVVSCGQSPATSGLTSEAALVIVIKGARDYYTVQWAERGMPSVLPMRIDMAKWVGRYQQLAPVRLCARVAGEKEPYPSCLNPE